jgi:hypothetical protein
MRDVTYWTLIAFVWIAVIYLIIFKWLFNKF